MRMAKRGGADPTPICRCRVLYLGSSVPQVTKDGLQGIQEPLRELYPAEGAVSARGIDSWLSVWSNGLLLENVDENQKKVTRFFPIESLHYCAAVRYVVVAGGEGAAVPRFLPLDSPFARNPNINHPPLFACIMRRTTGIKVLECHAFICKRETPANALVRCCFHAYADSMYARSLEGGSSSQYDSVYGGRVTEERVIEIEDLGSGTSEIIPASLGSSPTQDAPASPTSQGSPGDEVSIYNGDENHKVWAGPSKTETELIYSDYSGTLRSARSTSSIYGTAGGTRPPRPRQMMMPPVAPPPVPESDKDKKGKKEIKYKSRREEDEMSRVSNGAAPPRPASVVNGGGGGRHPNGSLPRHLNGHGSPPKSKGKFRFMQGTASLSERKSKGMRGPPPFVLVQGPQGPQPPPQGMHGPHGHPGSMGPPMVPPHMGHPPPMPPPHMMAVQGPPPPHMLPPPGLPPHAMMPPPGPVGPYGHPGPYGPPGRRPPSRVLEEPIYMPSNRPLSPTASYQPGHFPHEQYLMEQYATTGRPKHRKKKKSGGKKELDEDIYGKKGHLNERAFSYSIREEHRSRSYGSLAGLGEDTMTKKDREIMQMVADLDLSGDELERVDPRPGVYRPPHPDRLSASGTITSRISRASRR